jgi:light-harvesting complex 1 beta chain
MTAQTKPYSAGGAPMAQEVHKGFFPIFAAAFVVFLTIALVSQTLGWPWRSWLPGAEGTSSVWGGVKAAVYTVMSYLQ